MRALWVPVLTMAAVLAPVATAAAAPPATVTVLYFDNDTGDASLAYLGKGLADMMITDLAAVSAIQVVEREKLEALLKELKLQRTRYFDPKTAQQIGKGVGARFAVAGSFTQLAPEMRIDVRVIEIANGKVVKTSRVVGKKDQFFELQTKLVAQLVDGLSAVLGGADLGKAKETAAGHRVEDVDTALAYAQALDATDRGDLQAASKQMQQVMQRAPAFPLARARYMDIMKALYAAKDTRSKALAGNEAQLLAHVDKELASPKRDDRYFSYRVLRGQLFLLKLSQTTARPSADYAAWVRGYRDNQLAFVKEMLAVLGSSKPSSQLPSSREVTPEDEKLAQEMGIADPGEYSFMSPQFVMRDTAQLLMFGIPPFYGDLRIAKPICYYKIDPALSAQAMKLLDDALADIAVRERDMKARESVRTLQLYAKIYLILGQPEQAIGKLQTALDKFPKAEEFADTEAMLRGILDGKVKAPSCDPPH
ncbi:MAG TPA: CsgG/HfaB family protein [Kofleriaceae bacterium]|nr:CsgG/HfaB family protein [Kofleriaceae bacterium]